MGTTLTGKVISATYDALLKVTDNDAITSTAKRITDGLGNDTPLYISTTRIGIGVSPTTTFHVSGNSQIGGNLTVTGDLLVEGSTTTIDTSTLSVEDPLIIVGSNNTTSDAVDLGIYGVYDTSGSQNLYAGIFRRAADNKFHIFRDLQTEPTTTVNLSGTGYTVATLVGNVEGTLTGIIASSTTATTQSANNNSTKVATTAYVDNQVTLQDLDITDGTNNGSVDLDSQVLTFTQTANETTVEVNGQEVTFGLPSSISVNVTGDLTGDVYNADGSIILNTGDNSIDAVLSNGVRATTQSQGDNSTKVATTEYVDTTTGNYLPLSGGTITGELELNDILYTRSNLRVLNAAGTGWHTWATRASGKYDLNVNNVTGNLTATSVLADGVTATTQTQGDNSTKVATTAYVDSAIGDNNELSEVLVNGNTTGGTDISVGAGDDITFTDTSEALFGTGNDLKIYHNGSTSDIWNYTGDLRIRNNSNDSNIDISASNEAGTGSQVYIRANGSTGAAELFHYSYKKLETTSTGGKVTGDLYVTGAFLDSNNSSGTADQVLVSTGTGTDWQDLSDISGVDGSGATGQVAFWTDTDTISGENNLYWDSTNDRLGIGTTTMQGKLTVVGTTQTIVADLDANAEVGLSVMGVHSSNFVGMSIGSANSTKNSGVFRFKYNGVGSNNNYVGIGLYAADDILNVTGGGFVGIGTTSPDAIFHVAKANSGGIGGQIVIDNPTSSTLGNSVEISFLTDVGASGTNIRNARILAVNENAGSGAANMQFHTWNGSTSAERMRIDSSGNVGIGAQSVQRPLHIESTQPVIRLSDSNSTSTTDVSGWIEWYDRNNTARTGYLGFTSTGDSHFGIVNQIAGDVFVRTNNTERMRITSGGKVGIDETNPLAKLVVNQDSLVDTEGLWVQASNNPSDGGVAIFKSASKVGSIQSLGANSSLSFITNGSGTNTERMRIDSSGNVGIGTTNLTAGGSGTQTQTATPTRIVFNNNYSNGNTDASLKLYLFNDGATRHGFTSGPNYDIQYHSSGHSTLARHSFYTNNNFVMRIGTGDTTNVGIGETNPLSDLVVRSDSAGGRGGEITILNYASTTVGNEAALNFGLEASTYQADNGNAQIKGIVTDASNAASQMRFSLWNGGSFNEEFRMDNNGDFHALGDVVAYSTTISDARLKDNVKPLESSLDKIMNLKGVEYTWNNGSRKGQKDIGFIAQEVEDVIPEIVREKKVIFDDDTEYKTVDYEKITAVLVEAVKELKQEIVELKKQIK